VDVSEKGWLGISENHAKIECPQIIGIHSLSSLKSAEHPQTNKESTLALQNESFGNLRLNMDYVRYSISKEIFSIYFSV
jgi:hypothetical protein